MLVNSYLDLIQLLLNSVQSDLDELHFLYHFKYILRPIVMTNSPPLELISEIKFSNFNGLPAPSEKSKSLSFT